jgi:hypothetical protein
LQQQVPVLLAHVDRHARLVGDHRAGRVAVSESNTCGVFRDGIAARQCRLLFLSLLLGRLGLRRLRAQIRFDG